MAKKSSGPTMKDVAKEANVAIGTVSKVINNMPVGEEYRTRIEAAIQKLDYRVNYYAKGLRSNSTYTVALIVPNLINPYFCRIASCVNKNLAQNGYQMLLCCSEYDMVQEQNLVSLAEQKKVDGIICLSYNPNLKITEDFPFVSIDRYFGGKIPCISSDNYGGGIMAAEKLIECGCKNPVMFWTGLSLPHEPTKRRDGFTDACKSAGLPCHIQCVGEGVPFSVFEDYLKEHMKNGKSDIDGIFCVTDTLAVKTVKLLRGMGLRVPEDVQVIGFDGIRNMGDMEYLCSTIVQPVEQLAEACVNLILNKDNKNTPTLMCLPVQYQFGGTTKF